jgi:hypothetical protein
MNDAGPKVFYTSDGEKSGSMYLEDLLNNFDANGGWYGGYNKEDMKDELFSRGWYEGLQECGHYLVINLDKFNLAERS